MAGKEDLLNELEDVLRECSEYFPKCDYQIYEINSAFNQLKKQLTKYKRAFEILKKVEYKKISASQSLGLTQINIETENFIITNEEAELLEELMNGENR